MSKQITLQWIIIKTSSIAMLLSASTLLYFIIYSVPMNDLHSLYIQGDIIVYHAKSIACVGAIPLCFYFIFLSLRVFFSKGVAPPTKRTLIGTIWGAFSAFTFLIFLIIAFLLPVWLMFSPYSSCPQERLGAYYVTDLELCKTIDPRNWKIEK